MYRCNNCGEVFAERKEVREPHGECGGAAYETYYVCPCCGEADTESAERCDGCGSYGEVENGFCRDCRIIILKQFQTLMESFSVSERKFLNDFYEGQEF